jgi:hypothetical protein
LILVRNNYKKSCSLVAKHRVINQSPDSRKNDKRYEADHRHTEEYFGGKWHLACSR